MRTVTQLLPLVGVICAAPAFAAPICSDISAESPIIAGDLVSARTEAVNRAKLAAVEQTAGVAVNSRTIVENGALLDDIITTQMRGVLTGYRVLGEEHGNGSITVRINACVEPASARSAVSALAMNTAISVFVPADRPAEEGKKKGGYEEENLFSQVLMGRLAEHGFKVRDIADSHALQLKDIAAALKGGDQPAVRGLVYRHLTNSLLIGRVETTVSTAKGENVGYGIQTPFNKVTARLTYRLMVRDASGRMSVLAAGADEAFGLAPAVDDARSTALKNLADRFSPFILEKLNARLHELGAKITVAVEGLSDAAETLALRESLQRVTWVAGVESVAPGEFLITYPENPLYLANSLAQSGLKVITFTKERIRVSR